MAIDQILITKESVYETSFGVIDEVSGNAGVTLDESTFLKATNEYVTIIMEELQRIIENFDEYFDFEEAAVDAICRAANVNNIEQLIKDK